MALLPRRPAWTRCPPHTLTHAPTHTSSPHLLAAPPRRTSSPQERLRRLAEEEARRGQAALRAGYAREVSERYVKALLEDGVAKAVADAGREADERRLMAAEDLASAARRAEDDRLRLLRQTQLEELRRRAEAQACDDITTEVVQEELRKMLGDLERARLEALEAAQRAQEGLCVRALAEKVVGDAVEAALRRATEDDAGRARRLAEEEAGQARERDAEELRRMRWEDDIAQRERRRLRDLEDELRRLQVRGAFFLLLFLLFLLFTPFELPFAPT